MPLDESGFASFTLSLSAGIHEVRVIFFPSDPSFTASTASFFITAVEPTPTFAVTSFASILDTAPVADGSGLNDAGAGPASYAGGFFHQETGHVGYQNLSAEQQANFRGPDGQADEHHLFNWEPGAQDAHTVLALERLHAVIDDEAVMAFHPGSSGSRLEVISQENWDRDFMHVMDEWAELDVTKGPVDVLFLHAEAWLSG